MTCEQAIEAISASLDGALESKQADALQAHLASCAACRSIQAELKKTDELLRALPQEPCGDLTGCVMRRVHREPRAQKLRRSNALTALSIVAAIVVVVFPAIGLYEKNAQPVRTSSNAVSMADAMFPGQSDTGYAQQLAESYGASVMVVREKAAVPKDAEETELDDGSVLYRIDAQTAQALAQQTDCIVVSPPQSPDTPVGYLLLLP